jgi:hypothetical protein
MIASTGKYRRRGTGSIRNGYLSHVRDGKQKFDHVEIAEQMNGGPLPIGAVVHHVNEDKLDNRPENLFICRDAAHHRLLHREIEAKKACGHAHWRKCWICKEYDAPENLAISPNGHNVRHRSCQNERDRSK